MITVYPDNLWITSVIAAVIVIATSATAAAAVFRWGWKSLPLALVSGLVVPLLVFVIAMIVLTIGADYFGVTGLAVDGRSLLLIGLPSAGVGFTLALAKSVTASRS